MTDETAHETEGAGRTHADVATLDARMKAAGMIPLSDMLAGRDPLAPWTAHVGVRDMASFTQWLEDRHRSFLSMQVEFDLGDRNKDDELYEWVLSHAAAFGEVLANLRQAAKGDSRIDFGCMIDGK